VIIFKKKADTDNKAKLEKQYNDRAANSVA